MVCGSSSVHADAKVRHSVVGDGGRIDAGAIVEDSVLLPGVVVEAGATIRRSVVGASAIVSAGSSVLDLSMLGDGVRTAPGETLIGVRVPDPDAVA
jgi:ADP-glucose pyrophosphorylase